jgi:hypothetical protein
MFTVIVPPFTLSSLSSSIPAFYIFPFKEANKEEIITQIVSKQETKSSGKVVYKLVDVKAGDTIKVTTKCNKFGKKSAKLVLK